MRQLRRSSGTEAGYSSLLPTWAGNPSAENKPEALEDFPNSSGIQAPNPETQVHKEQKEVVGPFNGEGYEGDSKGRLRANHELGKMRGAEEERIYYRLVGFLR